MKIFLQIFVLGMLVASCKKSEPRTYFFSGFLYTSCNGLPVKNKAIRAWQFHPRKEQTIGTTTTDSNGYFKLRYYPTDVFGVIEIRYINNTYAVLRYVVDSSGINDLENFKLYEVTTSSTVVTLNVLNAYTNLDTLVANRGYPPNLKFAGPFHAWLPNAGTVRNYAGVNTEII